MKRMSWMLGSVVLGFATLTGCTSATSAGSEDDATGTTTSRLTVQGSVSERLNTDNARAVAINEDGKKIWTYLDKHGDFSLKLPAGKSYRVLIANQLPGGGQKVVGKLALKNGGTKTEWLKAKSGGRIDLGTLVKPKAETSGTIAPKCFCDEDFEKGGEDKEPTDDADWGDDGYGGDKEPSKDDWGGGGWDDEGDWANEKEEASNHDDDNDCYGDDEDFVKGGEELEAKDGVGGKEIDPDEVCDVCTDGEIVDLEPSKKDAGDWADVETKGKEKPEAKGCPNKPNKPAPEAPDAPKPTDDGATDEPSQPSVAPTQSKKIGDKCFVKNECGESVCIASKCQSK